MALKGWLQVTALSGSVPHPVLSEPFLRGQVWCLDGRAALAPVGQGSCLAEPRDPALTWQSRVIRLGGCEAMEGEGCAMGGAGAGGTVETLKSSQQVPTGSAARGPQGPQQSPLPCRQPGQAALSALH